MTSSVCCEAQNLKLDVEYLNEWAVKLGVDELLAQAQSDAAK